MMIADTAAEAAEMEAKRERDDMRAWQDFGLK